MKESKDYNKQEDFKECHENVGLGVAEENEGKEGADAPVKNCRANVVQSFLNALISATKKAQLYAMQKV